MRQFQKKPVVVEAVVYTYPASPELKAWLGPYAGPEQKSRHMDAKGELVVYTLEDGQGLQSRHTATEGDWIIKGIAGEFYPCKPEIFAATYSEV